MLDLQFRSRFLCAFYMFGSVRFRFGKQNFNWLVLFGSGRTVKHCFGQSLRLAKVKYDWNKSCSKFWGLAKSKIILKLFQLIILIHWFDYLQHYWFIGTNYFNINSKFTQFQVELFWQPSVMQCCRKCYLMICRYLHFFLCFLYRISLNKVRGH